MGLRDLKKGLSDLKKLFGKTNYEHVLKDGQIVLVVNGKQVGLDGVDAHTAIEAAKTSASLNKYKSVAAELKIDGDPLVAGYIKSENKRVGSMLNQATESTDKITLWRNREITGVEAVQEQQFRQRAEEGRRRNEKI